MITLAIFEDHPVVLKSLCDSFDALTGFKVLFGDKTKKIFLQNLRTFESPDIVILDLIASDVLGLELFEHIKKHHRKSKIIAFTSLSSVILVENLLMTGAKGYVNKNQDFEDLLQAVIEVAEGEISLPEDYKFLKKIDFGSKLNLLSPREIEIVQFISQEFTTTQIAAQLQLSINTIENHRKSIFKKLDVKNVAGMIREALKLGMISK